MTGISNLNILVQQGGNVQELNQTKLQSAEQTQMVAAQEQMTRTEESNAQVQEMEEFEKPCLKRDTSKEKRESQTSGEEKRQKKKREEKEAGSTGRILDTVA